MEPVDNNQFEIKPTSKSKRKIATPCPNVYLNPALDLLANEDPMCNNAMEIVPNKKRKQAKTPDIVAFENSALDLGISKAAVNEFLVRELENVRKNIRSYSTENLDAKEGLPIEEPIYANIGPDKDKVEPGNQIVNVNNPEESALSLIDPCNSIEVSEINNIDEIDSGISVLEQKSINTATFSQINDLDLSAITTTHTQTNITNQVIVNNTSNISLSFIDRLALDSPNVSNQSLYLDDDLNESNIMEIKTITIITKKKRIVDKKKSTNPFLNGDLNDVETDASAPNPFLLDDTNARPELEYNDIAMNRAVDELPQPNNLMPRRLFTSDTNSTISTVNESINTEQHEYENIDSYRSESPIYENVGDDTVIEPFNKQSKILGHDVSQFSAVDIMNLNKISQGNVSNDSNDSRKHLKHNFLKASNKLSKKVLKTLKKTFKSEKVDTNTTLNPYEVPRKPPKQKVVQKDEGIDNPVLNLDNSDEIEIEEVDDEEHQYETIKTIRNTQLNMNVTPLRERVNEDFSHNKTATPGKKVRFDSTLNQEKIITGNSFDYGIQSPGFDAKIDKYHDELENCINEKKFLQQNM